MIKASNNLTGKLNASIIHVYPELENIEITPAVEDQEFKSDMYGYDKVKVKGVQSYIDEDIKPEYIKDGVDILGVVGNVVELKGEEKVITPKTTLQTILPSEDKNGITKITVQPVDRTIDEDIKPENIIDGVEILGVVGNYKGIDTSDATVTPDKVLAGTTVYINNEKIEGTLPNNGELEFTPSDELQIVPEGYTSGGIVSAADITKLNEYDKCLMIANSIEDMSDYSHTTATAEDIVEGKTAYSNGERIVGTYQEKISTNIEGYAQNNTQFTIKNVIETIDLSKEDLSSFSSFLNAFNWSPSLKKVTMPENTSYITSVQQMFMGCTALEEFNYFDISNVTTKDGITNMLADEGGKLTDETLNTVLLMLSETNVPLEYRSFRRVAGYTYPQSRLQTLSNYQKFVDAGWSY